MSDNRTAEELGKIEAEKIYPVVTTHNWYAKENAAYRNGFEAGYANASQQTASLRESLAASERIRMSDAQSAIREANSLRGRIGQLQEEVERLRGDLYKIHIEVNNPNGLQVISGIAIRALSSKESKNDK